MTDKIHEERITAVHEAVAIQLAVLEELAKELRSERAFGLARDVDLVIRMLNGDGSPTERVVNAMPSIKALHVALQRSGKTQLVAAIAGVRDVLKRKFEKTLTDTQPLDVVIIDPDAPTKP